MVDLKGNKKKRKKDYRGRKNGRRKRQEKLRDSGRRGDNRTCKEGFMFDMIYINACLSVYLSVCLSVHPSVTPLMNFRNFCISILMLSSSSNRRANRVTSDSDRSTSHVFIAFKIGGDIEK